MIDRRKLIALLDGTILARPFEARGQQPGRIYRIGCLYPFPRDAPQHVAMFDELRRLGFIDGQNLTVDSRGFGLRSEQFSEAAVVLVNAPVDVVLAGVSLLATELDGKRQELLIELLPGAHHIAALADPNTTASRQLQALEDAARAHGVKLSAQRIGKPEEIVGAIDAAKAASAAALNVLALPLLFAQRQLIFERVAALRLPAIYQWPEMAREGGLTGYGPSIVQLFRDVLSRQLVKLLQGAKPADLPIEQPTKFELVINLKTAKALGLTVPPILFAQADEVIE
jgi:putative tryptophan/tyrosine transport system substrate-binding protein